MPRLKFSAVLPVTLAALAMLAALAAPASADPRSAANALFDDPVEREAFFAMMAADPALSAAVAKAEASGGVKAAPAAAEWRKSVLAELTKTRTALAAGIRQNPPAADYPAAPLVAPLIKSLKKQNAADLYVSLGATLAKHDAAAPPTAAPQACPPGAARKAFEQARAAAGSGDMTAVTGECQASPFAAAPASTAKDPKALLTPSAQVPPNVTDQRTTTGAPPAPGADSEKGAGGSGGLFSSLPWSKIGLGAGLGGMLGMAMGFGSPLGVVGGALIGAVLGAVMFSGVIGKLFGGGKSGS
ncbi:MAG TPA: hypothetical protein VN915_08585 [Elusimicrobiota bacterium]|nr:hypothetical protein [Elusimicrobiota bacterium]